MRSTGRPSADGNGRAARAEKSRPGYVLITGGAGFIGTNVAHHYASKGVPVVVFDNLSRPGVDRNLAWLRAAHGALVRPVVADVRDAGAVQRAVRNAGRVFHFAAQVAVTSSIDEPRLDYEVNIGGMLNVLEALRKRHDPPPLLFTSTNKVYGSLEDVPLRETATRYEVQARAAARGVSEARALDFHSPYGCSKGAADQYVIDYARTYGLANVVFRMSCIYGRHQCGTEDQGWVAHFLLQALAGAPLTIYGNGRQVRDILFADDLVRAMVLAHEQIDAVRGQAFNMGGGPERTISLLELIALVGELHGRKPAVRRAAWRLGDQRYYVSDTTKFRKATGWEPQMEVAEGVRILYHWLRENAPALSGNGQAARRAGGRLVSVGTGGR